MGRKITNYDKKHVELREERRARTQADPFAPYSRNGPRKRTDVSKTDIEAALITSGTVKTIEEASKVSVEVERRLLSAMKPLHMNRRQLWNMPQRRMMFRRCVLRLEQIIDGTIQEVEFDRQGKGHIVFPNALNVIKAAELLMAYAAGRPAQKVDVSVMSGMEKDVTPRMEITLNRTAIKEVQAVTDGIGISGIKLNLGRGTE